MSALGRLPFDGYADPDPHGQLTIGEAAAREHTHRLGGQAITHTHAAGEVRADVPLDGHGYYGHAQDRVGEPFGALEVTP